MKRNWKTIINRKARAVLGSSNATCNVALRHSKEGADAPQAEGYADGHTWDYEKSDDLYDNAFGLRSFQKGWLGKDFTGTLDIWVYSYEPFTDYPEELEFNLYAKFVDGKLVEVTQ